MKSWRLVGLCLLLGGCVYYNGVYNARRLAKSAERAEREGRTFDANSYWGQVAVKAESVIVRHPDSEWVDDALLLRGRALARMDQCDAALPTLEEAARRLPEADLREEALVELGRCQIRLGRRGAAAVTFGHLVESADSARRRLGRREVARVRWMEGAYDEALALLDPADGRTAGDRMVALAGAGRLDEAVALADTLLARADTTAPWDSALAAIGRRDPVRATTLLDRVLTLPYKHPTAHLGRLLADGERLLPLDTARAFARLQAVVQGGDATRHGQLARITMLRFRLAGTADGAGLAALADTLGRVAAGGGPAGIVAGALERGARQVGAALDSVPAGAPDGDLALFLAGEAARDTLGNRPLAGLLFRRVVQGWSASPYAPKALLAGRTIDPVLAAAADSLLAGPFAASPYVVAARGGEAPEWSALEDSLAGYAFAQRQARQPESGRRAGDRARRAPTGGVRAGDDLP